MAIEDRSLTRNIVIIGNPAAGGGAGQKIERAMAILRRKGRSVRLLLTAGRGDAEHFAREISNQPGILVIAAGGDGTYNEVANGLVFSDTPMAILPLGTTCVLAEELQIPGDLEKALDYAMKGKIEPVHLGRITLNPPIPLLDKKQPGQVVRVTRHFLLMAGIGFDGETVFRINERLKRYTGKVAYILSGLRTLMRYDPSPITLVALRDNEGREGSPGNSATGGGSDLNDTSTLRLAGYTAIVGKASCYGGNFKITPDARLTDPYLHIFLTHGKGRLDLLRYTLGILRGTHLSYRDVSYFKARRIEIQGDAHIQIDGDYAGTTPADIDVVPRALHLVTPAP